MAFVKKNDKKNLTLPGLIDIIFLLLIFSLVTLSASSSSIEAKKRGEQGVDFDLPEVKSAETYESEQILQTLMFQIERKDSRDPSSPRVVYVLQPSIRDSVTVDEAYARAARDSLFAEYPPDFLSLPDGRFARLPVNRMIRETLHDYKERHFFEPNPTNSIEIRAIKDTEFRIINFIMESCAAYGDTIPQCQFRTLTGKEVSSGLSIVP